MAYAERRERKKGVRYRGIYKAADGRYRSAGTFNTEERALAVALEAERHAAEVAGGVAGGSDPGTRARRTILTSIFRNHNRWSAVYKQNSATLYPAGPGTVTSAVVRCDSHDEAVPGALGACLA